MFTYCRKENDKLTLSIKVQERGSFFQQRHKICEKTSAKAK